MTVPVTEMIEVVKAYIKIRKNRDIEILIRCQNDIFLLEMAYISALKWFNENKTNGTT